MLPAERHRRSKEIAGESSVDEKGSQDQPPVDVAATAKQDQPTPATQRQDANDPKLSAEPRVVRYQRDEVPVFGPPIGEDR
jgi:hypothetical protein